MNDFWTYTVWYVLLAAVTLCELAVVLPRAGNPRLALAFYLTLVGIVLNFETVVLVFLKAYAYYPLLLQTSPVTFDRIVAGNLFSQTSVAATALLVAIFDLDFRWWVALAALYGLVEEAFLALGVYAHNWYRTWMTLLGLLVYFWLAKTMYAALLRGVRPLVFYCYVFLGLYPLCVITIVWGFMVSGYLSFSTALFPDPESSRYFLRLAIYATPAATVMMVVRYRGLSLFGAALAVLALYLFYYICSWFGLIVIREGWFWAVTTMTNVWMYASVRLISWLYADVKLKP